MFLFGSLILCAVSASVLAFSPYENRLMSQEKQRVGLMAFVESSQLQTIQSLVTEFNQKGGNLDTQAINNLSLYFPYTSIR